MTLSGEHTLRKDSRNAVLLIGKPFYSIIYFKTKFLEKTINYPDDLKMSTFAAYVSNGRVIELLLPVDSYIHS